MSGWLTACGLALAAFCACAFLFKAPRRGWEAIAAVLLLGIAGYALQARPTLQGAPTSAKASLADGSALVAVQQALAERRVGEGGKHMIIADAMIRHGQFGNAAGVLLGAVEQNPRDSDSWLALGNALVGHADGNLTPAALFAYRRSSEAAPDSPGPSFFMGLALAQSGRLGEGRAVWADLLARAPADAPWKADLSARLAALDRFIAEQQGAGTGQ